MPDTIDRDPELLELVDGYMPAFLIRAAMRLRLPEALGDTEATSAALARTTGTHEPSLTRMLRALAALGLMTEEPPSTFRLTSRGRLLRSDVPDSMHGTITVMLDDAMWSGWPALEHAVRTGRSAFEHVHGTDYMTHVGWKEGGALRDRVDRTMLEHTRGAAVAVLDAVDLGRFGTVVDIGGGSGPLVAAVLARHPHLRGVLFEHGDGARLAPGVLAEAGVADRCEIRTGDFRTSVPSGDLLLCKSVVFNWADDADVSALLANCRRAIADDGRLMLVEQMLPASVDGSMPAKVYVDDVNSIASLGGRLRTEPEYRALLDAAGFTMTAVRPLPTLAFGYSLLEAAPVGVGAVRAGA